MVKLANFEIYEETNKKQRVLASVSSSGRIAITEGAVRNFGLDKFKYALQLFDREQNLIGLQFFEKKSREGLLKIQTRENAGIFIIATNFLKKYNVLPTSANFFELRRSDALANVYEINLNNPMQRSYTGRKKQQTNE